MVKYKANTFTNNEDSRSPTISIDELMVSCVIKAMERILVVTMYTSQAFVQTDMMMK